MVKKYVFKADYNQRSYRIHIKKTSVEVIAITEKKVQELLQNKVKRSLSINCKKTEEQSKMGTKNWRYENYTRKFKFLWGVLTENGKFETEIRYANFNSK